MTGRSSRIGAAVRAGLAMLLLVAAAGVGRAQPVDALALMREGGNVLLIRHAATEPGVGDPPGFRLDDCATQRNLSAEGRSQAKALGDALRAARVPIAAVRSSRWCRCLDTARLAFQPQVAIEPWPALDSFFDDRDAEPRQTRAALAALAGVPAGSNWAWVTHQVNIGALTGVGAAPGEVVVARPAAGRLHVVARWQPSVRGD